MSLSALFPRAPMTALLGTVLALNLSCGRDNVCATDNDCASGHVCSSGICVDAPAPQPDAGNTDSGHACVPESDEEFCGSNCGQKLGFDNCAHSRDVMCGPCVMDGGPDAGARDGGVSDGGQDAGQGDAGATDAGAGDAGTSTDGGPNTDGGTVSDGGPNTDGGTVSDGGSNTDGGTVSDGGSIADGGTVTDGGPRDAGPCQTCGLPSSPLFVTASAGIGQVTVSWSASLFDGGSPITGYAVTTLRNGVAGATTMVEGSVYSTVITGLMGGFTYSFAVAAINANGTGDAELSDEVNLQSASSAPVSVTASYASGIMTVSWGAPASTGGSVLMGYTVTPSHGAAAKTVSASTLSTTFSGLTPGDYVFQVVATNGVGDSSPASSSTVNVPAALPGAPTNVTVTGGDRSAVVSWLAPTNDGGAPITGYVVTPKIGTTAGTSVTVDAAPTQTTLTGLTNGTRYTFTVAAKNSVGTGPVGTSPSLIVGLAPGAPTNVTGVPAHGQVTVSWTAPASAGSTAISQYIVLSTPAAGMATTTGATTVVVTGLTDGTPYTFTVYAVNSIRQGPASEPSAPITPLCSEGAACGDGMVCTHDQICARRPAWGDCDNNPSNGEETALLYNSMNCGTCGNKVDTYYPAGWGQCDMGVPRLLQCHSAPVSPADPNDRNTTTGLLQGWKPNASNTACTVCNPYLGGYDVPDNGIDEDCDGADATNSPSRGFYVDPNLGNDTIGDGSPQSPFKTFQPVIDLWYDSPDVARSHNEIYVAAGTITAPFAWADGAKIIGSYSRSGQGVWTRGSSITTTLHVQGTAIDVNQPEGASSSALSVFDGLAILVDQGATRRGVSYSGGARVYLQNMTLTTAEADATECEAILQGTDMTASVPPDSHLGVFSSAVAGSCQILLVTRGFDIKTASIQMELFGVDDQSIPFRGWFPEASAVSVVSSKIGTLGDSWANYGNSPPLTYTVVLSGITNFLKYYALDTSYVYRSAIGRDRSSSYETFAVDSEFSGEDGWSVFVLGQGSVGGGRLAGVGFYLSQGGVVRNTNATGAVGANIVSDSHLSGGSMILAENGVLERNVSYDGLIVNGSKVFVRNNLIVSSGNGVAMTMSNGGDSVVSDNTFVGARGSATSDCNLVTVQNTGTKFYGNAFVCANSSGARVALAEQSSNTEISALASNAFVNVGTLLLHDGSTAITSIQSLNHLSSLSGGMGGNIAVTTADAAFFAPASYDYSLLPSSILIGASPNLSSAAMGLVTEDFLGAPRPCGNGGWDIGAYAFCQ